MTCQSTSQKSIKLLVLFLPFKSSSKVTRNTSVDIRLTEHCDREYLTSTKSSDKVTESSSANTNSSDKVTGSTYVSTKSLDEVTESSSVNTKSAGQGLQGCVSGSSKTISCLLTISILGAKGLAKFH